MYAAPNVVPAGNASRISLLAAYENAPVDEALNVIVYFVAVEGAVPPTFTARFVIGWAAPTV